jgi:polyphosphate kinase
MATDYQRLLVAPNSVRSGLIERIDREIAHHLAGRPARIQFKCNALVDEAIIDALYRASNAGVPVDVFVRGICALRPGVPGLSEHIRVISILGRFLEHSRAYCFANGGARETWIGSADLMHRNLDRRVETLVRLTDPMQISAIAAMLDLAFDPRTSKWVLQSDGSWQRLVSGPDGEPLRDYQEALILEQRRHGAA